MKTRLLIMLVTGLLQTSIFSECDNCQIVEAVNNLQTNTLNALQGDAANSIINTLNTIFVATKNSSGSNEQSVLDKKIDMYTQKFYELYTTGFINTISDINKYHDMTSHGLNQLLKQDINYYLRANTEENNVAKDNHALLTQTVELGDNNIPPDTFLADNLPKYFGIGNPYSSLTSQNIQLPPASAALNVNALLGPDGYTKEEEKNAKLFINQIYRSLTLPETIQIPTKTTKNVTQPLTDQDGNVTMYIPYPYETTTGLKLPYTIAKVSTTKSVKTKIDGKTELTNEYEAMLKKLRSNPNYQKTTTKRRIMLALQSIYHDIILRFYQDRLRDKSKTGTNLSLTEKEKKMATEGLTKQYYDDLKNKSVADVNLETLYTLNKIVYFLHKLHQDNERTQLVLTTTAMSVQPSEHQDKTMAKLKDFFVKKCWDDSSENSDNQKACNAAQTEVEEKMPSTSSITPTQ